MWVVLSCYMHKNFFVLFLLLFVALPVSASAATLSVTSLTPGTSVLPKKLVTFKLSALGFASPLYQLTDSFGATSASSNNIDGGGNFSWVPSLTDVGTHTFTITARDNDGNVANTTQTITVLPAPSVSIQNVSATQVMPGTPFTFTIVTTGFTNPVFSVGDDVSGSGIDTSNLSGTTFRWVPVISNNGKHRITVYVSDSTGSSASTNIDLQVGKGPQILIQMTSTSTTVLPGTPISFVASPLQFAPTGYSISDTFSGTTISNSNINSSGTFWWTPQASDVGVHTVTIRGQVGAFGDVATTSVTLNVLGPNGMLPAPQTTPSPTSATSTTLSSLQAQLAALLAKTASLGVSANTSASTEPVQTFTSYLKPGSKGDEVLKLQNLLARLGFLTATPNGYYGVGTTAAVKAFQAAHGLSQLGVVGPATREALNSQGESTTSVSAPSMTATNGFKFEHFMGYGDDDTPDVAELQKYLQARGYLAASSPLGFYGTATENAVKKFQIARGLPSTGYCDKATRAELNK